MPYLDRFRCFIHNNQTAGGTEIDIQLIGNDGVYMIIICIMCLFLLNV